MSRRISLCALAALVPGAAAVGHLHGRVGSGSGSAQYSTNFICKQKYCTNPVFPAVRLFNYSVFKVQKARQWSCVNDLQAYKLTDFCSRVIMQYEFALPNTEQGQEKMLLADSVRKQDREAIAAYVAHISGLGLDFWDFREPWKSPNECVKSVWKIACYAHFPRCNEIDGTKYLKPCKSSCSNYVKSCGVECCDEGVQCVYDHKEVLADGTVLLEEGFEDHVGPSILCTGAALRQSGGAALAVLALAASLASTAWA